MVIVTFEGQSHTLDLADLRAIMQSIWTEPEPVADPQQQLFEALSQSQHPQAAATVAVLRRVFGLLTPEADSGVFRPRWADETHQQLIIDIEKRATTKGSLCDALMAQPDEINLVYVLACYLTWRERQEALGLIELMGIQPLIQTVLEQGRAELSATDALFARLAEQIGEAGKYLPLGF